MSGIQMEEREVVHISVQVGFCFQIHIHRTRFSVNSFILGFFKMPRINGESIL